jgi:hypothetical protein
VLVITLGANWEHNIINACASPFEGSKNRGDVAANPLQRGLPTCRAHRRLGAARPMAGQRLTLDAWPSIGAPDAVDVVECHLPGAG